MVSIRNLKSFIAVMETGQISAAANKIGLSQPGVSKSIKSLEIDIGSPLFLRERGRLVATPEAYYFEYVAKNIIDQLNDATRFLTDYGDANAGDLRILSTPGPSQFFLPKLVSDFAELRPKIKVSTFAWPTSNVINWIANNQVGVGLTELMEPHEALKSETISLGCMCAIPAGDELVGEEVITPEHLRNRDLATINTDSQIFSAIQAAFDESGVRLKPRFQNNFFIPIFSLVENLGVISIVDPISVKSYELYSGSPRGVTFRPFSPAVAHKVSVISPAHRPISRLEQAFKDEMVGALRLLANTNS